MASEGTGKARKALISLMCHPDRSPKIEVPPGEGYEAYVNKVPNYADAYREAIRRAAEAEMDLVTADTDGYHTVKEILKLAAAEFSREGPALILPYRENIGFQSKSFSYFFSLVRMRRIRDATGGLCRLSLELIRSLPPLKAADMTIHIEILKRAIGSGVPIVQYGYLSDVNDEGESRRTSNYQLKLLKAALT